MNFETLDLLHGSPLSCWWKPTDLEEYQLWSPILKTGREMHASSAVLVREASVDWRRGRELIMNGGKMTRETKIASINWIFFCRETYPRSPKIESRVNNGGLYHRETSFEWRKWMVVELGIVEARADEFRVAILPWTWHGVSGFQK